MKTFIIQIISSLFLGFFASNAFTVVFLQDYKSNLEKQANRHRVEMVLEGFIAGDRVSPSTDQVWSLQCHADNVQPTLMEVSDNIKLHTLTIDYHEGKLSAVFNEDAFRNDPIMIKLFWLNLFEGVIQVFFSVAILLFILRSWTDNIKALHWLSNQYAMGNFRAKIKVSGPKEIVTLVKNQHKMAFDINDLITKKNLFFASLPHDIRTPLSAIQLTCDMLSEEMKSSPFLLDRLDTQVTSLNRLCDSSLHLVKILNGDLKLDRKRINFHETMISVIDSLGHYKVVTFSSTDRWIYTDEKLLRILLLNILTNAYRHAKSGVHIQFSAYPGCDVIKVKNDGPKFEKDLIDDFNQGLFRFDRVSKDGFGFGLILIYELVKYLNGIALMNNSLAGAEIVLVMK